MRRWPAALSVVLLAVVWAADRSPYDVLGVQRGASELEVKQAYKRLAKQWHPDKNESPDAGKRFVEINDAYQTLASHRKRGDAAAGDGQQAFRMYNEFGNFRFHFTMPFLSFAKHAVDFRTYKETILTDSYTQPCMLIVYSAMCFSCVHIEPLWEQVSKKLAATGYCVASVNANFQRQLVEELGVKSVPTVLTVFAGDVQRCSSTYASRSDLLECARNAMPASLVTTLHSYDEFRNFQATSVDQNQVTVVFFTADAKPSLAHMLLAARLAVMCRFAHVRLDPSISLGHTVRRLKDFQVNIGHIGSVAIYKESAGQPVVAEPLSAATSDEDDDVPDDGSLTRLADLLNANRLLAFPRISSQQHFDAICVPDDGQQLCAILLAENKATSRVHIDGYLNSLANISRQLPPQRVSHCYVYLDSQSSFLKASFQMVSDLLKVDGDYRSVLLLRRQGRSRAQYKLLPNIWSGQRKALNSSVTRLSDELADAVGLKTHLDRWVTLVDVVDENVPGVYRRLARKLVRGVRQFFYSIGREEALPIVSVAFTFLIIILFGGLLHYAANVEERSRTRMAPSGPPKVDRSAVVAKLVRELRAETYFGMIRLLRPGCRTLAVMCDKSSKDILLEQFGSMIWPWRKNKNLMFGYVMAERNVDWFRQLLEMTLADASLSNINARNVVGTVLALNGFRQYYCVYHPKYRSSLKGSRQGKNRDRFFRGIGMTAADSDLTDSSEEERLEEKRLDEMQRRKSLKVDELLDGLPNWLERLFDGDVKRFYISEWPPMK